MIGRRTAGALLLPLLVVGCSSGTQAPPRPVAAPTSLLPTTTTTTSAPAAALTVQSIVDARTVALSDGSQVRVTGLATPGECWQAAAVEFANAMLVGQTVRVIREGETASLKLTDGTDYTLFAVGQGAARAENPRDQLLEAQTAAQKGPFGLWGSPCNGADATSTPPPPPPPPAPKPPPTTTTTPRPVFFFTCEEMRRAGAAPIRRGEPGYRFELDRNRNGLACD